MEVTSPEMRDKFIQVSQENSLRDLLGGSSDPKEPLSGTHEDDVAMDDWNHGLIGITRHGVKNVGVHLEKTGDAGVILSDRHDGNSSREHSEEPPRTTQKSSKASGNKMTVSVLLM